MTDTMQTTEVTQPASDVPAGTPKAGTDIPSQQPQGSLLTQTQEWTPPEKFVVKKETGDYDFKAIARKIDESRSSLEKRMGAGEAPPKDHTGYKVEVEGLDWAEYQKSPVVSKFLEDMHKAGANNAQVNAAVSGLRTVLDRMGEGEEAATVEKATAQLREVWKDADTYNTNLQNAFKGASKIAEQMGMTIGELEAAGLGNNPVFVRMMAEIAPMFMEDKAPNPDGQIPAEDINKMILSPEYQNTKHPDHAKVSEKVRKYFEAKHGA